MDEKTTMESNAGLALDDETAKDQPRVEIELEKAEDRVKDFREVEKGYSGAKEAHREAARCLRCDLEGERS
jgi:NADH-quinone oxidoreductase subunit F